jgi:hypothetical protein
VSDLPAVTVAPAVHVAPSVEKITVQDLG